MFNSLIYVLFFFAINFVSVSSLINIQKSELKNKPTTLISWNTSLGTLIGYKDLVQNKTINVFYGVPYAEPPILKNRFRRTKLIEKFANEIQEALHYKAHCYQNYTEKYHKDDQFSEDCLTLNIWSPDLEQNLDDDKKCKKRFNVMVYLFAGTSSIFQQFPFTDENNNSYLSYGGDVLAALHDTIVVTFNFRQGLLSSLYLEDVYSGNLALFDQNLALQFVKTYIMRDFCGDNKINLFANSFGANSIGIHLISKYSKNLIDQAIMQSSLPLFTHKRPITRNEIRINSFLAIYRLGCLNLKDSRINENIDNLDKEIRKKYFTLIDGKYELNEKRFINDLERNWLNTNPEPFSLSKLHGSNTIRDFLDKDTYLDEKILVLIKFLSKQHVANLECLENVSVERVFELDKVHNIADWQIYYDFDFIDTEAYLNYKLFNKLNLNPKVRLLMGAVKDENCISGINLMNQFYSDRFNAPILTREDAIELIYNCPLSFDGKEKLNSKIAEYYTDESKFELSKGFYDSYIDLRNEYFFKCPNYFYSNYASMNADKVYNYLISYRPSLHFESAVYRLDEKLNLSSYSWIGTCHGDDTNYVWGLPLKVRNMFTELDRNFSLSMMQIWATFAKTGKMPELTSGEDWPASDKSDPYPRFVEINGYYRREHKFEFEERCDKFWRNLLPLYKK